MNEMAASRQPRSDLRPRIAFDALACWLAAGLLCCGTITAQAWLFGDSRLSKLPTPVRQTVVSVLGSGRLTELWLTNENGHAVYEVEVRQRGVDRSFTVALDGSLLARQVFTNELPPSVIQTLQHETAGGKVLDLYWINEEGKTEVLTFPDPLQPTRPQD